MQVQVQVQRLPVAASLLAARWGNNSMMRNTCAFRVFLFLRCEKGGEQRDEQSCWFKAVSASWAGKQGVCARPVSWGVTATVG